MIKTVTVKRRRLAVAVALASAAACAGAQELEEVVVTAQKREQSLQDISLAVTAFSDEALKELGANNIERLDLLTPGLEWGQFGLGARVSIRGQGVANFEANTDGPVGFFVDGVYLGRGQQVWQVLTDIERVEVLRGPQGTLFGRNTTGGSINVVTAKPSSEKIEGQVSARVGNYDLYEVSGSVNLPINDQWATRFAFFREAHDGFIENTFDPNNDYLDEDITYGRAAIRFDNNANFTADLSVDYWEQGGNGAAFSGVKFFDQDEPGVNTWASSLLGLTGANRLPANPDDDWEIATGIQSQRDVRSFSVIAQLQYETDWAIFKSVTGFNDYDQFAGGDSDFSTFQLADLSLDTQARVFSQEVQVQSNYESKLNWIAGFYYMNEEIEELFRFNFVPGGFDFSTRDGTAEATSYAIFGQAEYDITDKFRLIFGGRYTVDDKSYSSVDRARVDDRGNINADETFSQFTWRAGFEYFATETSMIYFNASTGFKSGGFNRYRPQVGGVQYDLVFEPETLTNYEGGIKADWFGQRLRTNLAVFYNTIEDFQAYAFDNSVPTSVTTNAASASTMGVELEATFVPVERARFEAIIAYLDAEYDDYATFNNGSQNIDASGNTRELSPKWKTTLTARYDIPLGEWGTLTPYGQFTYKSEYFVTAANESRFGLDRQESYTQSDVKLLWTSADEHWSGEVFVQNIEDAFVKTGGFLATNGYWLTYGPMPRTYGVSLTYRY